MRLLWAVSARAREVKAASSFLHILNNLQNN